MHRYRKPLTTLLIFAAACVIPYLVPSLEQFRFVRAEQLHRAMQAWSEDPLPRMFPMRPKPPTIASAPGKPAPARPAPPRDDDDDATEIPTPPHIAMEGEDALARFYASLHATRGGSVAFDPHAITRIIHFGDSPVAADLITSGARTRLQQEFGDAGPGWHLPARPWEFYQHDGFTLKASGWKVLSPLLQAPGNKGDYGLAGIAFTSATAHASSEFSEWRRNPPRFSRLDIHYQAKPNGGTLIVTVDGQATSFSTAADTRAVKAQSLEFTDGPHEVEIHSKGDGEVTLFGVAMERDQPGVVYDSLGSVGTTIHKMTLPNLDEWTESLRLRHPHLVILGLGTNESGYGFLPPDQYEGDYRRIIAAIRAAAPDVSIVIMAPMDRGERNNDGHIVTMSTIPRLVEMQKQVAAEMHCAFFNTYEAMGGDGSMRRWYHGKPRLVGGDFTHPTGNGANRVANWLVSALLENFNQP